MPPAPPYAFGLRALRYAAVVVAMATSGGTLADPAATPDPQEPLVTERQEPTPLTPTSGGELPEVAPPVTPDPDVEEQSGKIKIRSNLRAIIYVDGEPEGYTPIDVILTPGRYIISSEPRGFGRKQEVVELASGGMQAVVFSFESQ